MARYKTLKIILVLIILFSFSYMFSRNFDRIDLSDKIVFIPIKGEIVSGENGGLLNNGVTASSDFIDYLNKARDDSTIKGVILEIDSPGGTAIGSKEIADAVKSFDKPIVAWIRGVGASGAYWVASATDAIVADPLSVTGSIGVISSYLDFEGLMQKYGVNYERLVTGKYKDLGSPYRTLTNEERQLLLSKLNLIHKVFSDDVSRNRKKDLSAYSTGEFFLGMEAKKIGLIDYLGNKETAINVTKKLAKLKDANIVVFKPKKGFLSSLDKYFSKYSYFIGLGISQGLSNTKSDLNINT